MSLIPIQLLTGSLTRPSGFEWEKVSVTSRTSLGKSCHRPRKAPKTLKIACLLFRLVCVKARKRAPELETKHQRGQEADCNIDWSMARYKFIHRFFSFFVYIYPKGDPLAALGASRRVVPSVTDCVPRYACMYETDNFPNTVKRSDSSILCGWVCILVEYQCHSRGGFGNDSVNTLRSIITDLICRL